MHLVRPRVASELTGYTARHCIRKGKDAEDPYPDLIPIGPSAVAFIREELEAYNERLVADKRGEKVPWLKRQIRKLQRELREAEGKESPDDVKSAADENFQTAGG